MRAALITAPVRVPAREREGEYYALRRQAALGSVQRFRLQLQSCRW
jgi:hypothetical protein